MGGKEFEVGPQTASGPKKGCWTKLTDRPNGDRDHGMHVVEVGSKRKNNVGDTVVTSEGDKEKKLKMDEEARRLGILFATHLGAAEVTKQPR